MFLRSCGSAKTVQMLTGFSGSAFSTFSGGGTEIIMLRLEISVIKLTRLELDSCKSGDPFAAFLGFSVTTFLAEPNVGFREDEIDDREGDERNAGRDVRREAPFSGEQGNESEHDTSVGPVTEGSQLESLVRGDEFREVGPSDDHSSGDSNSGERTEEVESGDGIEGGRERKRWDSDEHRQNERLLTAHLVSDVSENDVSDEYSDVLNECRTEVLPSRETVNSKLHGSRSVVAVRLFDVAVGEGRSSQVSAEIREVVVLETLALWHIEAYFACNLYCV